MTISFDGDRSKQTKECKAKNWTHSPDPKAPGYVIFWKCPNYKSTYDGMDGERYRCSVCGDSYFLDYEDMK